MKLEWDDSYTDQQCRLLDTHSWARYKYADWHLYKDIPDMICERCSYRVDIVGAYKSKITYEAYYHHRDAIYSCDEYVLKQVLE